MNQIENDPAPDDAEHAAAELLLRRMLGGLALYGAQVEVQTEP